VPCGFTGDRRAELYKVADREGEVEARAFGLRAFSPDFVTDDRGVRRVLRIIGYGDAFGGKGKERKGKERKGKGREGKGRKGKGREGNGREGRRERQGLCGDWITGTGRADQSIDADGNHSG
jgi:hypothetical protein